MCNLFWSVPRLGFFQGTQTKAWMPFRGPPFALYYGPAAHVIIYGHSCEYIYIYVYIYMYKHNIYIYIYILAAASWFLPILGCFVGRAPPHFSSLVFSGLRLHRAGRGRGRHLRALAAVHRRGRGQPQGAGGCGVRLRIGASRELAA